MQNTSDLEALKTALKKQLPLSEEQAARWLAVSKIRTYQKGEYIIKNGSTEKYLSLVLKGLTRHFIINTKGDDVNFDFSFQYDYSFAYGSFINQKPTEFFIQALTDVKLLSIPREKMIHLYENQPMANVFGRVSAEQYYLWREERELALQTLSPDERYKWLLEKHPRYLLEVPLKHLASFLNLTPETLSRIRKRFVH